MTWDPTVLTVAICGAGIALVLLGVLVIPAIWRSIDRAINNHVNVLVADALTAIHDARTSPIELPDFDVRELLDHDADD